MIEILIVKIILVIMSVATLGILPLVAWINQWIWNEIIIQHVITCGKEITSYWIMLGLTACGIGFPAGIKLTNRFNKK